MHTERPAWPPDRDWKVHGDGGPYRRGPRRADRAAQVRRSEPGRAFAAGLPLGQAWHPVCVLSVDPELGAAIPAPERQRAERYSTAAAFDLKPGPWAFTPPPDPGALGALVLDGLIVVRIEVGGRAHVELLGAGDVVNPWIGTGPDLALPNTVTAKIVSAARLALLDRAFALRTARWPEIHAALFQRLIVRSRRLSLQLAINALPKVEDRLECTLWQLAYRFGRMTGAGIRLELPITHAQLAEMVGAHRPSVTNTLSRMHSQGSLQRPGRRQWLLTGSAPTLLTALTQHAGLRA